jgi:hypothetical protein
MAGYKLTSEIIDLSEATGWDLAKLEWGLAEVYEADEPERCLCGHFPIKEVCVLTNQKNGNRTEVGNCCVKKFIGLPSDKIFQAVKRVRKDGEKSLNVEAVTHARQKGWINQWEFDFSIDTMRKRKLSTKQLDTRRKINAKMLANMKRK